MNDKRVDREETMNVSKAFCQTITTNPRPEYKEYAWNQREKGRANIETGANKQK